MNEPRELIASSKRFGSYLRRLREEKKLSLEAVAEMSAQFPEKLTKSHLSRLENGQAIPSFGRLYTLGRIYGVPAGNLAEQLELDLEIEQSPPDLEGLTDEQVVGKSKALIQAGHYNEALKLCTAALGRTQNRGPSDRTTTLDLRLHVVTCLLRTGRYLLAKEHAETLADFPAPDLERTLCAFHALIEAYWKLGRYRMAEMVLKEAEAFLSKPGAPFRLEADICSQRAAISELVGQHDLACRFYERAASLYDAGGVAHEACKARINVGAALIEMGKFEDAERVLLAAVKEAESKGYDHHSATALTHLAALFFNKGRLRESESFALRSNILARPIGDFNLVFRNCYYLFKVAIQAGDTKSARLNEQALRTYLSRVNERLEEVRAFRAYLSGGEA